MESQSSDSRVSARYMRMIAHAVATNMVVIVAYPVVVGHILLGLLLQGEAGPGESSSSAVVVFVLAGVWALAAAVAIVWLAIASLTELFAANLEFALDQPPARHRASTTVARNGSARSPALRDAPAAASVRPERVLVLSDTDKQRLAQVPPSSTEPGWYVDPLTGQGARWWNGSEWTGRVQRDTAGEVRG